MNLPDLRRKLDRLNKQIVGRLADRSRFAHCPIIYVPGGITVLGRVNQSFLQHALHGLEIYHATLGRYSYPDQHPLHRDVATHAPVERTVAIERLPMVSYPIAQQVHDYYVSIVPDICADGDDPQSYGEAAYIDADIMMLMHERINFGRYVAQVKVRQAPEILAPNRTVAHMRADLIHPERERQVIEAASEAAARLDLDRAVIERVFRWMIERTIDVEVDYLHVLRGNTQAT